VHRLCRFLCADWRLPNWGIPFLLVLAAPLLSFGAEPTAAKPKPAKLHISGYGILGNRELKRILRTLELAGHKPEFFGPTFVEDAALILTARIKRDGFLQPAITIRLTLADGVQMQAGADDLTDNPLPRPLRIKRVDFHIHKGVLYYFERLEFSGLGVIPQKQARSYFMDVESLIRLKQARIYTPERLDRGISSLTDVLAREGYDDARVSVQTLSRDDHTGAVVARVQVEPGPRYHVRSVQEEFFHSGENQPHARRTVFPNKSYSRLWLQDFTLSLKTNEFHQGYPDASVQTQTLARQTNGSRISLDLLATVRSGSQVHIGAVNFEGEKKTKRSLLLRRVRIQRGDLLDPIRVEEGRTRLARLGIFDTVDLNYNPVDDHTRDVTYVLKEGKTLNLSLLLGWGSYELLRGGFELAENNIWGLAHHARLRAIQSFKSSSGDLTYTIPEFVGRDIDLFLNGSGLRREEVSFTRLEYGGGIGLHKYFQTEATDVSARYNYQILSARDFGTFEAVASEGLTNPAVGSVMFEIKHDRRDNPLYPRHGYKVFATVETATEYLGGEANYERIEISPSVHFPLGGGRYVSLGVSHGVDVTFGSPANNLPFNRRFFPGGGNSIRGYGEGEASPKNAFGQIVGAETYTLGTVEIEQALTPKWSLVLFSDSLGFAHSIDHYPFDTGLFSVGGGLRWRTLIGPVRVEYGYNLNPRPGDPSGTFQFSLGFPF
jgi:outer membrane protein assembly factor BamA